MVGKKGTGAAARLFFHLAHPTFEFAHPGCSVLALWVGKNALLPTQITKCKV